MVIFNRHAWLGLTSCRCDRCFHFSQWVSKAIWPEGRRIISDFLNGASSGCTLEGGDIVRSVPLQAITLMIALSPNIRLSGWRTSLSVISILPTLGVRRLIRLRISWQSSWHGSTCCFPSSLRRLLACSAFLRGWLNSDFTKVVLPRWLDETRNGSATYAGSAVAVDVRAIMPDFHWKGHSRRFLHIHWAISRANFRGYTSVKAVRRMLWPFHRVCPSIGWCSWFLRQVLPCRDL